MSDEILKGLEPLFAEAERTGKWFWCAYQDLWFSPAKLREAQREGRFRWGAVNWSLREPGERVAEAEKRAKAAADDVERIRAETGRP